MSFHNHTKDTATSEQLSLYLNMHVSSDVGDQLRPDREISNFWTTQIREYPQLAYVVFRLYATLVSSASSGHEFSDVSNILNH